MQQTSVLLTAIHRCSPTTLKVSPGPQEVRVHSATPLPGHQLRVPRSNITICFLMLTSGDALVTRALLMSCMVQSFLQKVSLAPASSSRVQNRCVSNTLSSSGKVLNKLCISQVTLQIPFRDWERVRSSSHALH